MSTPTFTVNIQLTLQPQLLSDILTTAVEGGSNYWLAAQRIERLRDGGASLRYPGIQLDDLSVTAVVGPRDYGTGEARFDLTNFAKGFEGNRTADITLDTIAAGIRLLFQPGVLPKRADIRNAVLQGALDPRDADIDADMADVIVQLGFFGELVYG